MDPSWAIAIGEMSIGTLIASVPTIGPVFHPSRYRPNAKAKYQYKTSGKNLMRTREKLPGRGLESDTSNDRPFKSLAEDDVELELVSQPRNNYQVHAHGGGKKNPHQSLSPNQLEIRREFHVSESKS